MVPNGLKPDELIVDSFAGGGGSSLGIAWATGLAPDIAINHNADALAMHEANHPATMHVREDVWKSNLRKLAGWRPVGLLWASPDCRHHSRAKGSAPVSNSVRSLAWIVTKWAAEVRPRIICLENVREFADWGPIVPRWRCECGWRGTEGQITLANGRRKCVSCGKARGLVATEDMIPDPNRKGLTFRRFVGRLKNLGYAVSWKNLDAADYGAPTHRRRLFLVARRDGLPIMWPEPTHGDPENVASRGLFEDRKPWRTAAECIDWELPCPSIFDRKRPLAEATLRRIAHGVKRYVLENPKPFVVQVAGGPVSPIFVGAGGAAYQAKPVPVDQPMGVVKTDSRRSLVYAFLAKHFGGQIGSAVDKPAPTATVRSTQSQIVAASMVHMNHGEKAWNGVDEPMRTLTTGGHAGLVYAFLTRYFGTAIGQAIDDPGLTVTTKDRSGLVTVQVDGESFALVDIGMRMLTPRELARCQGFPDTYQLTGTKTSQIARIGNSVCPHVAAAVVRANVGVLQGAG